MTTVYEIDGKLCLGITNTSGPHSDPSVLIYDEIPPVRKLFVKVKCDRPENIYREPQHIKMPFEYSDGFVELCIENIELFDILAFE